MESKEQLSAMIEQYIERMPLPVRPASLYDPIRYSMEAGGKRIRPLLTMLACRTLGGDARQALPLAAAVEVFHNFTLLHDDVMDNAPLRRGRDSVWARWGADTAILSGDAMMIFAYKLLSESPAAVLAPLLEQFNAMAAEVCEGQQADMDFQSRDTVGIDEYMGMIALKTSALMARPMRMGALVAGAGEADCAAMYRFGHELGLAFQLSDDLLDSYCDNPAFGKKVGGDIIEGKKSFLAVTAMLRGDGEQRKGLASLLTDRDMSEGEKVARVRAIYDALDLRAATRAAIGERTSLAISALDAVNAPASALLPLRELAEGLRLRNK